MSGEPKVLLNAASISVGGGIQSAVSFIRHVLDRETGLRWHFVLSRPVATQLTRCGISIDALGADVLDGPPARDRRARRALRHIENRLRPAVVFTFFGPAYVRFRSPHLCGVADGWVTHATPLAYATLGGVGRAMRVFLLCLYKGLWYRAADHWLVEAESARQGLSRRFAIPADRIAVIANSCAAHYREACNVSPLLEPGERFRLLAFAAYYPHKNLEIVPEVAACLKRAGLGRQMEFVLTLRHEEPALARIQARARELDVPDMINNIGPVDIIDGPRLYRSCHTAFIPTVLETFSAAYPEAMAMGLPIITTDLDFARTICGPAAIYYRPKDAGSAAEAIHSVYSRADLRDRLVEEGARRLAMLPTAAARNDAIVDLIRRMLPQDPARQRPQEARRQ